MLENHMSNVAVLQHLTACDRGLNRSAPAYADMLAAQMSKQCSVALKAAQSEEQSHGWPAKP